MAHYFDDIFTRHAVQDKTNKPNPKMRRSSTTRSIGARSDFDMSVNGDHDEVQSIGNSVESETAERERERQEADAHTANYVSEQLSRVRSHQSADFEIGDEFEAQLDGQ
jgi:hypothetical protein